MVVIMSAYLSLDLDTVNIDTTLAQRLPPGLAAYYLALPIGSEDGFVSVAMAHPENESALVVLAALLGGPIVPVRATDVAIRQALGRMADTFPAAQPRVLVWSADSLSLDTAGTIASLFARAVDAAVTIVGASELDFETALTVAREGAYDLTVVSAPVETTPVRLLAQATTSLVFLSALPVALLRILVVLRGYSADCQALEWLASLMRQPGAAVTLLPLLPAAQSGVPSPLSLRGAQNHHLQECLHHAALHDVPVFVRFRQGTAADQIVAEVRDGAYDLVVIAAEGYGRFVSRVLARLEQTGSRKQCFLILKPPAAGKPLKADTRQEGA